MTTWLATAGRSSRRSRRAVRSRTRTRRFGSCPMWVRRPPRARALMRCPRSMFSRARKPGLVRSPTRTRHHPPTSRSLAPSRRWPMLLVVTNSEDATADYFCRRLRRARLPFIRFDSDADVRRLRVAYDERGARLRIHGRWYAPSEFSNVWLRRPRPIAPAAGRDAAERQHVAAEWGEALEGFLAHIPVRRWINHPTANVLASHKLEQL